MAGGPVTVPVFPCILAQRCRYISVPCPVYLFSLCPFNLCFCTCFLLLLLLSLVLFLISFLLLLMSVVFPFTLRHSKAASEGNAKVYLFFVSSSLNLFYFSLISCPFPCYLFPFSLISFPFPFSCFPFLCCFLLIPLSFSFLLSFSLLYFL